MDNGNTTETKELAAPDERAEVAGLLANERQHYTGMSLPEWYMKVLGECELMERRIKEQAERLIAQVSARKRALEWRWGREFRELVERDLSQQKGKKKSVDYLTGRAGYRTTPGRFIVKDGKVLEDWCSENFPEGLRLQISPSKIKEHVQATGEVPPGSEWAPPQEKFYPATDAPALPEEVGDAAE